MRLVRFGHHYINPDKVEYVQKLASLVRLFLTSGQTIDVDESEATVVFRLTQEGTWENRNKN